MELDMRSSATFCDIPSHLKRRPRSTAPAGDAPQSTWRRPWLTAR